MTDAAVLLTDLLPPAPPPGQAADPDQLYETFTGWCADRGLTPYAHQEEAAIELFTGGNVILATPTGSGKSLVAIAAHFAALANDQVTFYTAPIKALVSEKFFDLCAIFGPANVGMLTGDASINPDAQIICCTAEVLANIALREGEHADIGQVVMDEFHFYSEPDRGWAWQVPLLALPQAQFLLMSATLGDVSRFRDDLTRRTGRPTAVVDDAVRPVPLSFEWSMTPIAETIVDLLQTRRAPVYVVHFTQKAALEQAQALVSQTILTREQKDAVAEAIGGFRFAAGFGKTLSRLLRHGVGVHHAGMLPRYRRLVEQLAQAGHLKVICGTDTLGVGINVPIRTVLFTGLTKFDGSRSRVLRAREFHQIAGRAGRAGFDTHGYVVVQAPEHTIENARLVERAGDDPKKLKKLVRRKPPEGFVNWTEETFTKLINAAPETLSSRMRVNHAMLVNVMARPSDPVAVMSRLIRDNHEEPRNRTKLARRAVTLLRSLLDSGVVERLEAPDEHGRRLRMTVELQDNFALNQPLSPFAMAAVELLDPDSPSYALDVVSVIESTLEDPFPILLAQQWKARGAAVAEMKADGVEYDERMELLEDVSWPRPLEELLTAALATYRRSQPWVPEDALSPKSIVRDMYERAMSFGEFVAFYEVARAEGLVLRYLSDAFRALRQTVPENARTEPLMDVIEWLGEVVRQTDSSLLDEWEALADPDAYAAAAAAGSLTEAVATTSRPVTGNVRALRVMVRNALRRRVELIARDEWEALGALESAVGALTEPPVAPVMTAQAWDAAMADYYDEHDEVLLDADARGPGLIRIDEDVAAHPGVWRVVQVIHDPEGNHDWRIEAEVDLGASDHVGEAVVRATSFARLG